MNRQERQLQAGLRFFALYSLVFAVLYVLMGAFGNSSFAFTADATAKDGLFTIVALIGAADVRRHTWATLTIIAGHAVIVAALVMMLVLGHADTFAGTLDGPLRGGAHAFAIKWLVGAAAVVVIFSVLRSRALRARLDIAYLGPGEFLTLAALAEVLIDTDPSVPPLEVAQNTDAYLRRFDAEGKWRIRLALLALSVAPLLWFHAPFSVMSPEGRREFLEKRFLRSRLPRFLRLVEQSMIRAGSQMAYIGYYRDPRSYAECGYRPIAARSEVEERLSLMPSPPPARLECLLPGNAEERMIADVVVIGTGAGGATVAHGLAAKGREVLMIERGPHVDPSQFSTDEATQLADLYRDGALTLSRDFRFHVLQGMCVGGSTVVNNAVCFRIEDELLERWNGDGYEAGLDPARLAASYAALEHRLHVTEIDPAVSNPGYQPFEAGVVKLGMDAMFAPVKTNIKDCLGCGFCNSGCAYGRKLSMLDGTLPAAQAAAGADAFRVLAEAQVLKITHDGRRASGVVCRLSDGRTIEVRAKTIVVAAGALASSVILRRSGIGGDRVGHGLAFNIGSPIVADMPHLVRSTEGLQITHALKFPDKPVALESWFMPLLGMSLLMPGWFGDHQRNMRRYGHLAAIGVVVGSQGNATVKPSRLSRRAVDLDYVPTDRDRTLLLDGIRAATEIFLAAGATRVMAPTFTYTEARHPDEIDAFVASVRDDDLLINTAHPQGGNAISTNPDRGVVGNDLRVHGTDNVFVCDASVFPSSITLNPQLTVMALADYAVDPVAAS